MCERMQKGLCMRVLCFNDSAPQTFDSSPPMWGDDRRVKWSMTHGDMELSWYHSKEPQLAAPKKKKKRRLNT